MKSLITRGPCREFLVGILVIALGMGGGMSIPGLGAASLVQGIRVGNHVPPLSLADLSGGTHEIRWNGEGASGTVIFFFDIKSSDGVYGMTYFDRLSREAGDFGLEVLAVEASGLSKEEIEGAIERYLSIYPAPPFPIIPDEEQSLRHLFGFERTPATYVVEKHGAVLMHREGFDERTAAAVTDRIRSLLRLPPGVVEGGPEDSSLTAPAGGDEAPRPLLFPGERAPAFTVSDTSGRRHIFRWDSEGGVSIFFFFDDPCSSCIEEMIYLDQVSRKAADMGLAIRIVAVEAGGLDDVGIAAVMDRYRKLYSNPAFPIVLDSESNLSGIFGWGSIPTTFFLDGRGTVLDMAEGFDSSLAGEWTKLIKQAVPRAEGVLESEPVLE